MQLIFDVGNSNIVIAIYNGKEWKAIKRIETKKSIPEVYYHGVLTDMLLESEITHEDILNIYISSVVSEVSNDLMHAVQQYFGVEPKLLSADDFINLDMHIPKPYEIGSDLVANAYYAIKKYDHDCIVVDFGTALTFTVVTKNHGIEGVTIAPGLRTSIKALFLGTSKLPEVPLELPSSVIGKNTIHAIQAGVLYGYVGLVKEMITRIRNERGNNCMVVATGGLSSILPPLHQYFDEVDPCLTLEGIKMIGEKCG